MFSACSKKGIVFACLLMVSSVSGVSAYATAPPANERVFVGRLMSTTLRPEHDPAAERAFAKAHPNVVVIDNGCAKASTTYAVITALGERTDHMVVHSSIDEFCNLPAGMDGNPALIDVVRSGNTWVVKQAYEFEMTHDATPALMPDDDAMVCGIRLWDLSTPLAPEDRGPDVEPRHFTPTRLQSLIASGVVHRDTDGHLVYGAAIRMQDLLKALAASPCHLRSTDSE